MTDRIEDAEDALAEELMLFIEDAIEQILDEEDDGRFFAWMQAEAPRRLPGLFADLPNEQAARAISFEMGREIWNLVPLPGSGYRPRTIPRPERNAPCPCGSGQKYKKCCGAVSGGRIELPFQAEDAWALVLAGSPEAEVAQLSAERRVPRVLIPGIADRLVVNGEPEVALSLLEPFFEQAERLDERDAAAVEALVDAYDLLDLEESKERAIARLDSTLPPSLRLVLWETLARSFTARGDTERAWEAAQRVRRSDPDSPVLGPVEVLLLLGSDRLEEASERAKEALKRHRSHPGLSDEALALLEETAESPAASQRRLMLAELLPSVERLERLLANLSERPVRAYAVSTEGERPGTGRLLPPEELRAVDAGWVEAGLPDLEDLGDDAWDEEDEEDDEKEDGDEEGVEWELDDEESDWDEDDAEYDGWDEEIEEVWMAGEADPWLIYLEEVPDALDSLFVLSDLVDRAAELAIRRYPRLHETLVRPLVIRGMAILDASLAAAPQVALPGDLEENYPALEILEESASLSGEPVPDREPLERLLQLDPEDTLNVRSDLGTSYLWAGEPQKTLDLAARFPGDEEPGLAFARVAALHRLQRQEEALAALDEAVERFPRIGAGIVLGSARVPDPLIELWDNDEELFQELKKRMDRL
ncbi:MAG TPA: SEC-C metal-binding domain-containing protein [Thermoanaerobaculia bacterium]|nr:SEC-C metal-binding domain-containing protein [Thermoanaerobaculia bacterium]